VDAPVKVACVQAEPVILDRDATIEKLARLAAEAAAEGARAAREAGACGIWANLLFLRPGTREHFMANLQRDWPELVPEYEEL
jgi:hypothetical protein